MVEARVILGFFLALVCRAASLPTYEAVRARYESSDARLLDRQGRLLEEQRMSWKERSLAWVPLDAVSPALREAVLRAEDRRFPEHNGVDWLALGAAAWQDLWRGSHRGASTITMQTVGYLTEGKPHGRRRGLAEKWSQARLALELERGWTKNQILETYLNLVPFRGEYRGIDAAARALFGRDPHGLDLRESALLATLLRAPGMSAAAAGQRLCLEARARTELGSCDQLRAFAAEALGAAHPPPPHAAFAPHLARRLLGTKDREVRATVDLPIQIAAEKAVREQLASLREQNVRDAAVIVVDNRTQEVLAYVGGSGETSATPAVDMAQALRQAGSSLKPFLYGLAFDRGYLTPESWLLDEPFELGLDRGSYEPDNYDHLFHGPVRAREALASSLNIPAVRVLDLVGVEDFRSLLSHLGFRALEDADHYGPSLALGTADVSLFDLTTAYVTLANGGVWRPLRFRLGEKAQPGKRLLGRRAAAQIAAILSDRGNRALTFGWDSLLATPYPASVKTGTSKDMRDNWCVGFSPDFTVGVWVGNGAGEPMWAVSGTAGAAPVWRALMDQLHRGRKPRALPILVEDAPAPDLERGHFGHILYPARGEIFAVDPDIPPSHQRVLLEAEGNGQLILDGAPLADPLWRLVPGKHSLSLNDARGRVLDELHFEVR